MAVVSWIHLSDWHQRGPSFARSVLRDALLADLLTRSQIDTRLEELHFVVFSGDLSFSGSADELETVQVELLQPVLQAIRLNTDRVFMVPGNHDQDRAEAKWISSELIGAIKDDADGNLLANTSRRTQLLLPFGAFSEFAERNGYAGHLLGDVTDTYVAKLAIADQQVAFCGMNSALLSWYGNRDAQSGVSDQGGLVVGEARLYEVLRKAEAADLNIFVTHHPLDWLVPSDRVAAERLMAEHADVLLRGHEHRPDFRSTNTVDGTFVDIPAGASYDRSSQGSVFGESYNFAVFDTSSRELTIHFRKWSRERSAWVPYHDVAKDGKLKRRLGPSKRARSSASQVKAATPAAPEAGRDGLARGEQRALPRKRRSRTIEFRVADAEGVFTVGEFEDGSPAEIHIRVSRQGSTVTGFLNALTDMASLALRIGLPPRELVREWANTRFEPSGMTSDTDFRVATSILDYIARRFATEYLDDEERHAMGIRTTEERTARILSP